MAKTKEVAGKWAKEFSREDLEVAAYYHWQQRGCPENDEMCDWVEAEKGLAGARQ